MHSHLKCSIVANYADSSVTGDDRFGKSHESDGERFVCLYMYTFICLIQAVTAFPLHPFTMFTFICKIIIYTYN